MSYSRRQLEAFGEPLGECVTRKEGGRIIYGGGGSSAPSQQTTVSELPEWAKPSAQKVLAKGEALTDRGYVPYGGERIAGFQPLQQQAFGSAAELGPSQAGQFGMGLAGAAASRALGARYNPYQTGQFQGETAASYMSPFIQEALQPQMREAIRASEIQRQADQAQAVQRGAYGGSRQAILEAERQRNLGTQLGDIQARGLQSAFDRAQQQFNTEQQLREQSRQFGGSFGLQGLQTALQGAGQLGQLGTQAFGQQKEAIGLQSQLGGQQQALEQQRMSQQYQDFLNQQKYPYQQLEFMSNLIRGTPMGTVQTLYGAPPNMLGQLTGLGIGAYGLSQTAKAFGAKEGGLASSYAEGGSVDDPQNVERIVSKLSDVQLQQAAQAAQARGDVDQLQAIQQEMAMRASERSGIAGAFNQLPPESQERMMAGGGIVAFAEPTKDNNYSLVSSDTPSAEEIEAAKKPYFGSPMVVRPRGKEYGDSGFLKRVSEFLVPSTYAVDRPAEDTSAATPYDAATATRRVNYETPASRLGSKAGEKTAPRAPSAPGAPAPKETSFIDDLRAAQGFFRDPESEAAKKSLFDLIAKQGQRSEDIKKQGLANALTQFGFGMAAQAAQPGARGLSGLLRSAAAASPILAQSAARTQQLASEAADNNLKMQIEMQKYNIAENKNDRNAMISAAQNIRVLRQQQAQLDETRRHNQAVEGITRSRLAASGQAMDKAIMQTKANIWTKSVADANKNWLLMPKEEKKQYGSVQNYAKSLFDEGWSSAMPQLELIGKISRSDTGD